jgi:hypothetical protein
MKKLYILLFILSFFVQSNGQNKDAWKLIGLYSGSIVLNAVGDGLNNDNHKTAGHICNAGSIGLLVASPLIIDYNRKKWYVYALTYTSLRISLFDPVYNSTRGLPLNYIGSTSLWDKYLGVFKPSDGFLFGRGCIFIFSVTFPIQELKQHPKKF